MAAAEVPWQTHFQVLTRPRSWCWPGWIKVRLGLACRTLQQTLRASLSFAQSLKGTPLLLSFLDVQPFPLGLQS